MSKVKQATKSKANKPAANPSAAVEIDLDKYSRTADKHAYHEDPSKISARKEKVLMSECP